MNKSKVGFGNSIGGRLILISSIVIIFSLGLLTIVALTQMSNALQEESFAKLEAIHNEKYAQLHEVLSEAEHNGELIAQSFAVEIAVEELIKYHEEMGISALGNFDLTGEGPGLTKGYTELWTETNSHLQPYTDILEFHDVFLICKNHGHVMYTNARENDLGENLSVGELRDSGLAKVWAKVVAEEHASVVDLEHYEPSGGKPAMFFGAPVYEEGEFAAVVVLQLNVEKFSEILMESSGMGESGEVFAVGEDYLMRTESHFSEPGETTILTRKVETTASHILGEETRETHHGIFPNYHGVEVLSVYSHADINDEMNADFDWALIAEIEQEEVMSHIYDLVGIIIAVALGLLFVSIIIMIFFARSLTNPIKAGVAAAEKISVGDLNQSLDAKHLSRRDEIGLLSNSLQSMIGKLTETVGSILVGSEQIASASAQLASGNQDLSSRTEQQASALEETSSAIEEMNSSVKSNADNTRTADQLARDAVAKTETGSESVGKVIASMNEINSSSNKIAEIIEVINNIAFQTNLLALNASIEAARAGEQGKGFAVVAVEVRKLAKRSDKAASEIAEIIKDSNKKVEEGVQVANSAGDVLLEINEAVKKVTTLVAEISAASQEQLSSVDEIDKTLSSLDENTQKNAALVEEAASSTEELSGQAQELNSTMKFFKVNSVGKRQQPALEDKRSADVSLLEAPEKKVTKTEEADSKSEVYETFTGMVDEGEFDEF